MLNALVLQYLSARYKASWVTLRGEVEPCEVDEEVCARTDLLALLRGRVNIGDLCDVRQQRGRLDAANTRIAQLEVELADAVANLADVRAEAAAAASAAQIAAANVLEFKGRLDDEPHTVRNTATCSDAVDGPAVPIVNVLDEVVESLPALSRALVMSERHSLLPLIVATIKAHPLVKICNITFAFAP